MPFLADHLARSFINRLKCMPKRLACLLPCQCALCGDVAEYPLCAACDLQYFRTSAQRCPRCGIPMSRQASATNCAACLRHPPAFDATIAVTDYTPPIDQLVLALKFGRQLALAPAFSHLMERAIYDAGIPRPDMLIAVPLGRKRLVERGFNQSLEMARHLAKTLELPLEKQCLVRRRETMPQSLLPPKERRRNIKHAFTADYRALDKIKGKHIAIVDDVMTTGETLHEAAATLKRFGAARVTNMVFARA